MLGLYLLYSWATIADYRIIIAYLAGAYARPLFYPPSIRENRSIYKKKGVIRRLVRWRCEFQEQEILREGNVTPFTWFTHFPCSLEQPPRMNSKYGLFLRNEV